MLRSCFALGALICSAAFAAEPYTLSHSTPIGAPDRWDLLTFDPGTGNVYIAHGDRVTVVKGTTGEKIADIPGFAGGTHGVAIVPGTSKGYSDEGESGLARAFDIKTMMAAASIKADKDADAIAYDSASRHVFVINSDPGTITVVDPARDAAVATIPVGEKLEIAVADGRGNLFVNGEEKRDLVKVDTRTNKVAAHWPINACESPHGIAVDTEAKRLFVTCANQLMVVVNADSGSVVASLPIGARTDGAAFDPVRHRAFSSNGDGTLTVVQESSPDSFKVLANVKTEPSARTMTLDPASGRLYLIAADTVAPAAGAANARRTVKPGTARILVYEPDAATGGRAASSHP